MSGDELMKTKFPPEKPEHSYRRGYHDGWVQAIDALHDLMFRDGLSRQAAYDAAWDHGERELAEWVKADCDKETWPPPIGKGTKHD